MISTEIGKVYKMIPAAGITAVTRQQWQNTTLIIDCSGVKQDGTEYERYVSIACSGELDRMLRANIYPLGMKVEVRFVPNSRAWTDKNGAERWSTDLRGVEIKEVRTNVHNTPSAAPQPAPEATPQSQPVQQSQPQQSAPAIPAAPQQTTDEGELPF